MNVVYWTHNMHFIGKQPLVTNIALIKEELYIVIPTCFWNSMS